MIYFILAFIFCILGAMYSIMTLRPGMFLVYIALYFLIMVLMRYSVMVSPQQLINAQDTVKKMQETPALMIAFAELINRESWDTSEAYWTRTINHGRNITDGADLNKFIQEIKNVKRS